MGPEALERARSEDKPIFLSIGYAACHWCHVMERESFEDPVTAAELARDFVAIKVDREERPDLDQVYMGAVQAMTGQGGWPMSMFLTPDGRPFYGGTYFPAVPRGEMPAFRQVLAGVARAWHEQRPELEASGDRLVAGLVAQIRASQAESIMPAETPPALPSGAPVAAVAALQATFDARFGGWGRAPKFPQPMTIEFLLRRLSQPGADTDGCAERCSGRPSTPWPPAACAISSAEGFTATRPMASGWRRTSSRCSTTMPSWAGPTSMPGSCWAMSSDLAVARATLDAIIRDFSTAGRRPGRQP